MLRAAAALGVVGAAAVGAALTPSGERRMYRGRVDQARLAEGGGVAAAVLGYKYIPLATLDEVHYANEMPWDPTFARTGVYVQPSVYSEADRAGRLVPGASEGREVHAIFEARKSLLGTYVPLDDWSNLDIRAFASTTIPSSK